MFAFCLILRHIHKSRGALSLLLTHANVLQVCSPSEVSMLAFANWNLPQGPANGSTIDFSGIWSNKIKKEKTVFLFLHDGVRRYLTESPKWLEFIPRGSGTPAQHFIRNVWHQRRNRTLETVSCQSPFIVLPGKHLIFVQWHLKKINI